MISNQNAYTAHVLELYKIEAEAIISHVNHLQMKFVEGKDYRDSIRINRIKFWKLADRYDRPITPEFIVFIERMNSSTKPIFEFWDIPDKLRTDELCKYYILERNIEGLQSASKKLRKDRDFVMKAILKNSSNYSGATFFKQDLELLMLANTPGNSRILDRAYLGFKKDKELVKQLIVTNPSALTYAHQSLLISKRFLWECYKINPACLDGLFKNMRFQDRMGNKDTFISNMTKNDIEVAIEPNEETELEAKARRKRQSGM